MSTRPQPSTPPGGTPLSRWSRAVRTGICGALAAAGLGIAAAPGVTAPASAATAVTVTPNPWYASEPFEGWGTSLAWFANATGDYPTELRQKLYDLLFSDQGLDLTVARYNVGGGNASDVSDYLRPGGAVDGYWKADADGTSGLYQDANGANVPTTVANKASVLSSFDPGDDRYYDWSKDATQRWWLEKLEADKQLTHLEAFVNSAPYFMTNSGYVSGGTNATAEQLSTTNGSVDKYVGYLTHVVDHLEQQYGITVDTIDPFNEPNTNYWSTTLKNGVPTGGRQEGMHVGPAMQKTVIDALRKALDADGSTTEAAISAMDETNPGTFVTNWNAYDAAQRDAVGQMNTHTYSTGSRLAVRDQSKVADKPLWMSEVEGDWSDSTGFDPADIDNAIGMAGHITGDLRELEPTSWVLWQPVEDLYNMDGTYSDSENLNWGSVYIDFDCRYYDENGDGEDQPSEFKSARRVAKAGGDSTKVAPCDVRVNSKFNVMRNYTNFIHPGDSLVPTNDADTTAAVDRAGDATTVVYTNSAATAKSVKVDLSRFGSIADGATATAYVTTQPDSADTVADVEKSGIVAQDAVPVDGSSVTIDVPAKSVTTIVVHGVSGVSATAAVHDGETYQVVGTQSGKALTDATGTTATTATTITTPATTKDQVAPQLWTFHQLPGGKQSATKRFVLAAQDGDVLTATTAGTALSPLSLDEAAKSANATWILNTTDGTRYSLLNAAIGQVIEVGGQSTTNGAGVGVYGSNGGANQSWTIRSTTATGSVDQVVSTPVGTAPTLPATATPTYPWGRGEPAAVTWEQPPAATWRKAGEVTVTGTGTDAYGSSFTARVKVVVGSYTATDPVSVTVVRGSTLADVKAAAPKTVQARIGAAADTFASEVTWDFGDLGDASFTQSGVVAVPGTVASNDPAADPVPAQLSVIVTDPAPVANICTVDKGVTVTASYTESGYPASNTCDDSASTRWSNWVSSGRSSDSLTYAFSSKYQVDGVTITPFERAPLTATVTYLAGDGTWKDVQVTDPGTALSTTAPTTIRFAPVTTTSIRVAFTFNSYGKVAEVAIAGASAGPSQVSSLAALRLDGTAVPGFEPGTADYTAVTGGDRFPAVQAVPTDRNATVSIQDATAEHPVTTITVTAPGGATTTYHVAFDVDRTAPQVTTSVAPTTPDGEDGWYRTTPTLAVTTDDAAAAIEYRLPGGDWTAYTEDVQVPDVVGSVEVRATDAVGNVSETKQVALKVDTVAPSVGYAVTKRTLTLTALDANATRILYSVDGGDATRYDGPVALGDARSVTFHAVDAAGNTSDSSTVDVTKDTAKVGLGLDRATTVYGGAPIRATVTVSGKDLDGGTVTLSDSGKVVAQGRLTAGRVVLTVPATLSVGTHRLTAVFTPAADGSTNGAISATRSVQVTKASSRTSVTVDKVKAKGGPRVAVTVRSSTSAAVTGSVEVTVRKGGTRVASATVTLHGGRASLRVPHRRLRPGTYRVNVRYTGSSTVDGSTRTVTVKVRR